MIQLDLKNPSYDKFLFENIIIKRKKLSKYPIIKKNLDFLINDISNYFVKNYDRFLTLVKILSLTGINLRYIDYYCHNFRKKWYQKLCNKYGTVYCYMPALTCFLIGPKIKVNIGKVYLDLTFANLIFYKHLFQDGIYSEILVNKNSIRKHLNQKNQNKPLSPVLTEVRNKILQINNKLLIPFSYDSNTNSYISTKKITFDHQIEEYQLIKSYHNGFKVKASFSSLKEASEEIKKYNNDVTIYQQIGIINVLEQKKPSNSKTKKFITKKNKSIDFQIFFLIITAIILFYFINN